jgi:hypothetical protein
VPVRKIPRSHCSLTGIHAGGPGGRGVAFESSLERDFITLQLFDPDVLAIEEQPVEIRYEAGNGRTARYVPDFLVHYRRPGRFPALFEVKYSVELAAKRKEFRARFEAARTYAAARGWEFRVATEHDIRNARLENAKFLVPFRRRGADPGRCARILRVLGAQGAMPISVLLETAWPDARERQFGTHCLWHLISGYRVAADLDRPLTMESVVDAGKDADALEV